MIYFRWINPSKQRHPWHSLSGNTTLFHHTQHGVLEQIKSWRKNRGITNDQPNLVILFTTGVVYVNYLVQKGFTFILHEELFSAAKIQNMMRGSLLAVTSLKLMSCEKCTQQSDVMALNIPQTGLTNT